MARWSSLAPACAALLLAACSSDGEPRADASISGGADGGTTADSGTPDGGSGPLALSDYCTSLHTAVCDGMRSCGCTLEGRRYDLESCASVRIAECTTALAPFATAVEAGQLAFDGEAARRCRDRVAALAGSCTIVAARTLPAVCAQLFVDLAALDGTCTSPLGTVCAAGAGVCGANNRCVLRPGSGEACEARTCSEGLVCDEATNRCGPTPEPTPIAEGQGPCTSSWECAAGLACAADNVCRRGLERDAECGNQNACASSLACVRHYENRTCGPKVALGGACARNTDCAAASACIGGVCTTPPGENSPCAESSDGFVCAAPFACDTDDSRNCVVAPGQGEPCLIGSGICAAGLGCDPDRNVCIAPPGEGQACTLPNLLCGPGLGCDFTAAGSVCAATRARGEACSSHQICGDGLFCDFIAGSCQPWVTAGGACPQGEVCAPGLECSDLAGSDQCQPIPATAGAACLETCAGDLACTGAGGICAAEICASP